MNTSNFMPTLILVSINQNPIALSTTVDKNMELQHTVNTQIYCIN